MSEEVNRNLEEDSAYSGRISDRFRSQIAARCADEVADFLLPHLQSGMRLLDCGCGPGSITIGLAQAVVPGEATGVDVSERALQMARERAQQQQVGNVRFVEGSVYDLDFPDASFDAVFAHALLQHLKEPLRALREMHRVLKPGGVIGLREVDRGGWLLAPEDPLLLEAMNLEKAFIEHHGGNSQIGRQLPHLLHQTGFIDIDAAARYRTICTQADAQSWAEQQRALVMEPDILDAIQSWGLADLQKVETLLDAWQSWSERPGAFMAQSNCSAVAWTP